jgi:hypothetical protein
MLIIAFEFYQSKLKPKLNQLNTGLTDPKSLDYFLGCD